MAPTLATGLLLVGWCTGASAAISPGVVAVGQAPSLQRGTAAVGALASATPLRTQVTLKPRDAPGLAALALATSTPGSALFHQYLRRGEFAARFGASPATVAAVDAALRAAGLSPGPVSANGLSIPVAADAAQASRAFHVGLERYRVPGGRLAYANTSAPRVAQSVAPAIQGVLGLSTLSVEHGALVDPAAPSGTGGALPRASISTAGPHACSAASSAATSTGPYTIDQVASAYGMSGLYAAGDLGQGVTVAIYELEPNAAGDIGTYQSCLGTATTISYEQVDGGAGPAGPGSGEAALDIENVLGLASRSRIEVYQGPNNGASGPYDTYQAMVNDDSAQVISTSWGACEAQTDPQELAAENTLFEQAAAQGQSILAAAGDTGSEDCTDSSGNATSQLAVDDPASQPFVTGVGGTTLTALGPPPSQSVWNNASHAGGGGISARWTMPSYQSGSGASGVMNSFSTGTTCSAPSGSRCREVPDVSADADPRTGYLIYWNGAWRAAGGTSAAAPLWAGLTALADASSGCAAGAPLGFLNPRLYAIAAATHGSDAFTDVTAGANDSTGTNAGAYPATSGYDMASGLGTPMATAASANGLVAQLCASDARAGAPDVTHVTPDAGPQAGGQTVTIDGAGFVANATVSFAGTPATGVQVLSYNQLTAQTPPGSASVDVTVTTPSGTSTTAASDRYTYNPPAPSTTTSSTAPSAATSTAPAPSAPPAAGPPALAPPAPATAQTLTPTAPAPVLTLTTPPHARVTSAATGGLHLRLRQRGSLVLLGSASCPDACTLSVSAYASVPGTSARQHRASTTQNARVGSLRLRVRPGSTRQLALQLTAAGVSLLRHRHRVALKITLQVTDQHGVIRHVTRTLMVRTPH